MIEQRSSKKRISLDVFIKLAIGFQLLTVLLFVLGPREWKGVNEWAVLFYVLLNCLGLYIGYRLAINKLPQHQDDAKCASGDRFQSNFIYVVMIMSTIILFIDMINTIKVTDLSLNSIIDAIKLGFSNPSEAYHKESGIVIGGQYFTYLKVLTSPLVWASILLGIYYFKHFNIAFKLILIVNVILEALKWIGCGTNKGLFDLIFIVVAVYLVKLIKKGYILRKSIKRMVIVGGLLLICGIAYFSIAIASRTNSNINYDSTFYVINTDNILWKICPDDLKFTFNSVLGYVTQGYYGLGLAFNESPVCMFGIGNSPFLLDNVEQIFNVDLQELSLQYKIYLSTGWHYSVNWHTIYTWIANDVTIYFVPFVMIIIGNFFGRIVIDIRCRNSNVSITLFVLMIINFFYFSANNQIMNYATTAFTFIVDVIIWFMRPRVIRRGLATSTTARSKK